VASIVFAWELGGDLGHLSGFLPLATALRQKGHDVAFVLRDLIHAESLVVSQGFPVFQAPVFTGTITGLGEAPLNYSGILLRNGYVYQSLLSGLVAAWSNLFRLLKPTLLIADHSPVALFAARTLGIQSTPLGTGFCAPPNVHPLPNLRPWMDIPQQVLEETDERVLDVANSLLKEKYPDVPCCNMLQTCSRDRKTFFALLLSSITMNSEGQPGIGARY
jgi:hypothetical protein